LLVRYEQGGRLVVDRHPSCTRRREGDSVAPPPLGGKLGNAPGAQETERERGWLLEGPACHWE